MGRITLAFLLVVLIGNPVCCCALGHCAPSTEVRTDSDSPLPPCCRAKLAEQCPDSEEAPEGPCPCRNNCLATGSEPIQAPGAPVGVPLPSVRPVESFHFHAILPPLPHTMPPTEIRSVAPAPPARILYGVFRC